MAELHGNFLTLPKLVWPVVAALALVAVLTGAGLNSMAIRDAAAAAEAARVARLKAAATPPKPPVPPPPAMITPPPVEAVLKSGTLIVISKNSQRMFVFSDGVLWASTPVSTGMRRHETPSGVYPILQKQLYHRSNIYSGAPMPFMQRLTWTGIALHAGWVPGYPASHGCVRVPPALAKTLFQLTTASKTTVVIADDPMDTDVHAQQFALTTKLPVQAQLAPPTAPPPVPTAAVVAPSVPPVSPPPALPAVPAPPPVLPGPATGGQTIQLTAAASQADAEAYWARLLTTRPELGRFTKSVELATVNTRRVYRLRVTGADAHAYCLKLKTGGISCINVG